MNIFTKRGRERSAFHPGPEYLLHLRPYTFAQTTLSLSFFACIQAADHTFRMAATRFPPNSSTAGKPAGSRKTQLNP